MRPIFALAALALAGCASQPPYSNVIDTTGRGVGFSDYAQYMRAQDELTRIRQQRAARQAAPRRQEAGARPQDQTDTGQQRARTAQAERAQRRSDPAPRPAQQAATARSDAFSRDGMSISPAREAQPRQARATPQPGAQPRQARAAQQPGAPLSATRQPDTGTPPPDPEGVSEQTYEAQPFGTPTQNRVVRRDRVPQVRVTPDQAAAGSGPNLFVYALSTRHAVGETRYSRRNPFRWRRWEAACAQHPHQDLAQEAFLAAGGPEDDPENLDPDGDGYACWWDPAPFRQAATTVKARE